jgi:hypothetical protein
MLISINVKEKIRHTITNFFQKVDILIRQVFVNIWYLSNTLKFSNIVVLFPSTEMNASVAIP